jgi:hypothetical protein
MCGDWNTRIGDLAPTIDDISTARLSDDKQTSPRTRWLLDLCEQQGWLILNGVQPGPPACTTFRRGEDRSCIDFIMTNKYSCKIHYDPTTLMGLSDHVFLRTTVDIPYLTSRRPTRDQNHTEEVTYKWIDGTQLADYSESAKIWEAHT